MTRLSSWKGNSTLDVLDNDTKANFQESLNGKRTILHSDIPFRFYKIRGTVSVLVIVSSNLLNLFDNFLSAFFAQFQ